MKVLFLSALFDGGGAERIARELFEAMPSMGIEAEMYVARRSKGAPATVRAIRLPGEKWLRAFELGGVPCDWRHLGSKLVLKRVARERSFDLIHAHNILGNWLSLSALRELAEHVPLIWSLHDASAISGAAHELTTVLPLEEVRRRWPDDSALDPTNPLTRKRRDRFLANLPKPAALISHGEYVHSLIEQSERWNQTPHYKVACGVSLLENPVCRMEQGAARARWGIGPNERVVVTVANHLQSPFKGMPWALQAMKELAEPCTWLLVGRGGEELARLVSQKTICTGFLEDTTALGSAYRAADVMLFPSIAEAFGLVGAEAMACERPVVGFRTSGLIELVGNNERGLLARPFDASELSSHLSELLKNPRRANELGKAGEQWVSRNCRLADSVKAVVRIYHEVLEHKSGQTATLAAQRSTT